MTRSYFFTIPRHLDRENKATSLDHKQKIYKEITGSVQCKKCKGIIKINAEQKNIHNNQNGD